MAPKAPVRDRGPHLFNPVAFRSVTARNRIMMSPMCQYCATSGTPDDWHFQHLSARAVGGTGIVFTEATHVEARGRITPHCLGLWNDEQRDAFKRIASFVKSQGAVAGIQLAHAGRKASTKRPWDGGKPLSREEGAWQVIGPSALPFALEYAVPIEMDRKTIGETIELFVASARRAREAGFQVLEVHAAHGYLLHSFLSPLSNQRTDEYGGSFDNRIRLLVQTVDAVRGVWPEELPLFVRISCTDWVDGGWNIDDSIRLAGMLKAAGKVDLIDCSSGGLDPRQAIPTSPGYQLFFAESIRRRAGVATAAVGLIHSPDFAEHIVANQHADLVVLGRTLLAEPYWPLRAAKALRAPTPWPRQYERANIF
ncbi:MAG: NADH:flavin oxidoreductase/NADH oxidase [Betaproteobacteria bacterium]|nr:NADH:flavin oxidoreductase/NADH oxidase [Betaproteobacteria bacterium]